jgi:hypothetical protein
VLVGTAAVVRGVGMLIEVAKPVVFVFCILSLYALFHAAFLNPASDLDQRVYESLSLLALAACISVAGALVFRQAARASYSRRARLTSTLPMQLFVWASGVMLILFLVSLYLESHCVFYRDVRVF